MRGAALITGILLLAGCGPTTYDAPLGDTKGRSFEESVVGYEEAEGHRAGLLGAHAGTLSGFLFAPEIPPHRQASPQVREFLLLANRSGEPEAVKGYCEKALAMEPAHPELWNSLGLARIRLGDDLGAEEAFDDALDLDPSYEPAQLNLDRMSER